MTLDQLKQLDYPILTRAIAEVVNLGEVKWIENKEYKKLVVLIPLGGYEYSERVIKTTKYFASQRFFNPLTSIDDAVLCVSKLDGIQQERYAEYLAGYLAKRDAWSESSGCTLGVPNVLDIIQCSAELRIIALWNTVPKIGVRYNQLKGER